MKETLKNSKGITLIALVLTIIILIILAGISISIVMGNNGLVPTAKKAAENYQLAADEEQTSLNQLYGQLDNGIAVAGTSFAEQTIGTATSDKILKDYTAYVNGQLVTGTIENRGTLNWNPSESTSLTIEPGYYSGGTISTENAYQAGQDSKKSMEELVQVANLNTETMDSAPTVTASFVGEANQIYYVNGRYATWTGSGIGTANICNRTEFTNATILEQNVNLFMIKIRVINDGTVNITMNTTVGEGYKSRFFLRVYK